MSITCVDMNHSSDRIGIFPARNANMLPSGNTGMGLSWKALERPPCNGYRNLLHIVRSWLPHAGKFPKRESEFLGKLLLLNAHSELAQDKDMLAYAWCIAEALDWKASAFLKKKLAEFLLDALPFIRQEDSTLFARVKQALRTHDHSMAR